MNTTQLYEQIVACRNRTRNDRALLVGISGIDASGKGYVARILDSRLVSSGHRVALINVDGWLNLPDVRFSTGSGNDPGTHFYNHALRLDEMFERLILPLKRNREIDLTMDFAEETATEFREHNYSFSNVDIVLLEGIFIFKQRFVPHFDLKIWIECGFDTALDRAIGRGQENLPPADTIKAYQSIYFPAQRHHFAIDDPRNAADITYPNEQKLELGNARPS